jgi:hypothetical protein
LPKTKTTTTTPKEEHTNKMKNNVTNLYLKKKNIE